MKVLRQLLLSALILVSGAGSVGATWSIVAIDRATGEVCVASATCIANFNLKKWVPVLVVGVGGGAAQSVPDASGDNRLLMRDLLIAGATPAEILATLEQSDASHQTRQYGIAGFSGDPVTFTGAGAGDAALGVTGRVGTVEYAIQGNVLAGDPVVFLAEAAFRGSDGDLSQRVMEAMEGARSMGGDGRCSCDDQLPDSCGSPPPNFDKSAHCAFIVLARHGDTDGGCDTAVGCADGDYYLKRNVIQNASEPDPVIELARRYAAWRANKSGRPDHLRTQVELAAPRLVADGVSATEVTLRLVDLDGVPLTSGGQTVTVTDLGGGAPVASAGTVTDNGDGTHTFSLTATDNPGSGRFRLVVTQGALDVQLFPDLELEVDPATDLHAGWSQVSASAGAEVPLTLGRSPAEAGRAYLILASASGTSPGTPFGGLVVPLNNDRILRWSLDDRSVLFPDSSGTLDASGRATATFRALPGLLVPFVASRFDFCALLGPGPDEVTSVAGFDIVP